MAHNLLGERFYGLREPAWHKLGTVSEEPITAIEAAARVGLDSIWIEKYPALVDLGGVMTSFGQYAIVRSPTHDDPQYRVLGTCGENYGLIQHNDLARKLEPLTEEWPVETMGVLNDGATLFVALDAGSAEISGEEIRQFFLLADTKDGKTGISLHFTPVRVVCDNTLSMGKDAAIVSAQLRHTSNVEQELDWRLDIMRNLTDVADRQIAVLAQLAALDLDSDQVERILSKAYPMPRKPRKVEMSEALSAEDLERLALGGLLDAMKQSERGWETDKRRIEERKAAARGLFDRFNDQHPQNARTGWAVYNAVVELEDYREKSGNEDPYVSALFGNRALTKARAYEAALAEID